MNIPLEIKTILNTLHENEYEAYIVGGCVRDLLLALSKAEGVGKNPTDWDITTNATPEQIQEVFTKAGLKSFYENNFGTVSVLTGSADATLQNVEITPFRTEAKYSDKRHPDTIKWAKKLEDDLSRRDFTVNAMAIKTNLKSKNENLKSKSTISNLAIIDLFNGQEDLQNQVIRAVGKPEQRFQEDALRLLRAIRFATTLNPAKLWQIESKTEKAIIKNAELLKYVSQERIRDELVKIIMSPQADQGIEILHKLGLLTYIMPELENGIGITQNKHHTFQVYEHAILSLRYACQQNFSLEVRMASLLHDIGKPTTKRGEGENATFYNHELVGARIANQILRRLRFSKKTTDKITKLVKHHLFYYNVGEVGESSVRRLLRQVGQEDIEELLQVRYADRIGSGVAKAEPYKLRHMKYLFEKVKQDPIIPKMLKVNGKDVIKIFNTKPGPKVGQALNYLLSQVLSNPKKNNRDLLMAELEKLSKLSEQELQNLSQKAKKDIEQVDTKRDEMTKKKYWVS